MPSPIQRRTLLRSPTVVAAVGSGKRYWKLSVAGRTAGSILSINTLSLMIGGVDQAAGAVTATASSEFGGGFEAANAFDGVTATRWANDGETNSWLTADFGVGVSKSITSFKIVHNDEGAGPAAFVLASSPDDVTYTTEKSVSGLVGGDWTGNSFAGGDSSGITWSIP